MDFIQETKKIWDTYLFGNMEDCSKLLDGLMSDCVVIGTGKHEMYYSRDSLLEALAAEIEERQFIKFQYKDFWCEKKEISSDVCLVYGGLHIWWEKEDKSVSINMDSRFTILFKCVNDQWKVIHIHQSMPNIEQAEGEYYPKRLLDLYNTEKKKTEELRNLAENDPLTGLLNIKAFQTLFEESLEKNRWLIAIDIDNFKTVNDTYGHLAGNQILQAAADIFKSSVRYGDRVCRMGGDEFLILCYGIRDSKKLSFLLDRIRNGIEKISLYEDCRIGVSIGAARIKQDETFASTLERADTALYEAKKNGKNQWKISELE